MELYVSIKVKDQRFTFRQQLVESRVPKGFPERLAWIKALVGAAVSNIMKQMSDQRKKEESTASV